MQLFRIQVVWIVGIFAAANGQPIDDSLGFPFEGIDDKAGNPLEGTPVTDFVQHDLQRLDEELDNAFNSTPTQRSANSIECRAVYPEYRIQCDVSAFPKYADAILNNPKFCQRVGCCFDPTFPQETGYPKCFQKGRETLKIVMRENLNMSET